MMPKDHPTIGGNKITTVIEAFSRGLMDIIKAEHLSRQKATIETVANRVHADCRDDKPRSVDTFSPVCRDYANRPRANKSSRNPDQACDPPHDIPSSCTATPSSKATVHFF